MFRVASVGRGQAATVVVSNPMSLIAILSISTACVLRQRCAVRLLLLRLTRFVVVEPALGEKSPLGVHTLENGPFEGGVDRPKLKLIWTRLRGHPLFLSNSSPEGSRDVRTNACR